MFRIDADKQISERPISKLIYGNFIELGLGREVDGMWSQMLFNRSFENIPAYSAYTIYETGDEINEKAPWWHSGYEEELWYTYDETGKTLVERERHCRYWGFHHGKQYLTVSGDNGLWGFGQDGLWLRAGVSYQFRGFMACNIGTRKVKVRLIAQDRVISSSECEIGTDYSECNVTLPNPSYTGRASLEVEADWPGQIRADGFKLYPNDAVKGWRSDVVQAMKQIRPAILRFPGGCFASFYNWQQGIGHRDDRMPMRSEYWGGLEYNDVGTDEYLDLCEIVGCEPFICVNLMTGSPELAADWVAYCNDSTDSLWGKRRAANGHPEPRKVTYWELDNEIFRKYSLEQYGHKVVAFAKAMKAVDPSIKLVIVGYDWAEDLPKLLEICGEYIDLISDRSYEESDIARNIANLSDYQKETGKRIGLCNTEWVAPTDPPPGAPEEIKDRTKLQRWYYAMNAASILQRFWQNADWMDFSNFNNMANSWGLNTIECSKSSAWLSCAGKVFEFYSESKAAWPVELTPSNKDGLVHIGAAWSESLDELVVNVINMGRETSVEVELCGKWMVSSSRGIAAESLISRNTESEKDAVKPFTPDAGFEDQKLRIDLPAYSICEVSLGNR